MAPTFGQPQICPGCKKNVYFGERIAAVGRDWHRGCFRCSHLPCNTVLVPGKETVHENKPYCARCYGALYGPRGFGRGGVESHTFCDGKTGGSAREDDQRDSVLINNNGRAH